MQRTANFHHHVTYPLCPHPDGLCERTATFDTAINLFDAHPSARNRAVVRLLFWGQLMPARLLCGLEDLHTLQREPLKAQILQPLTPHRQRIRRRVGQTLVVDTARSGLTEEHDAQPGMDQEQVFQHMPLFLAAITRLLFSRVCGARNGSLGAIMTKRGAAAGVAVWAAADGADSTGRSASASPSWWRKASTRRHGTSPQVRKAFRNTGSKT